MGVYACIVLLVVGEALMSAGQLLSPQFSAARLYRQAQCHDCLCSLQAKVEDRKINAILFGSDDVFKKQIFNCTDQILPRPYYYPGAVRCSCTEDKEPVVECEAKIWRLQPIKHKTCPCTGMICQEAGYIPGVGDSIAVVTKIPDGCECTTLERTTVPCKLFVSRCRRLAHNSGGRR